MECASRHAKITGMVPRGRAGRIDFRFPSCTAEVRGEGGRCAAGPVRTSRESAGGPRRAGGLPAGRPCRPGAARPGWRCRSASSERTGPSCRRQRPAEPVRAGGVLGRGVPAALVRDDVVEGRVLGGGHQLVGHLPGTAGGRLGHRGARQCCPGHHDGGGREVGAGGPCAAERAGRRSRTVTGPSGSPARSAGRRSTAWCAAHPWACVPRRRRPGGHGRTAAARAPLRRRGTSPTPCPHRRGALTCPSGCPEGCPCDCRRGSPHRCRSQCQGTVCPPESGAHTVVGTSSSAPG